MKIIEKLSDARVALIATIIPLTLMILWHMNNVGLPVADANDFLYSASNLVNYLYDGNIDRFLYALYLQLHTQYKIIRGNFIHIFLQRIY